jgi:hypothetical protein
MASPALSALEKSKKCQQADGSEHRTTGGLRLQDPKKQRQALKEDQYDPERHYPVKRILDTKLVGTELHTQIDWQIGPRGEVYAPTWVRL